MSERTPLPEEQVYTHKGWMMFCPVKMAGLDDPHGVIVAARWWILEPLFWLAEKVQQLIIGLCSLFYEDYEPQFWFTVTGELE